MNPGDSMPGTGRPGPDDPVQDIQDLIDQLAAVTLQLRQAGGGSLTASSR
jgi:hypothetical protein